MFKLFDDFEGQHPSFGHAAHYVSVQPNREKIPTHGVALACLACVNGI